MTDRWNPEGCPTSVLDMVPPGVSRPSSQARTGAIPLPRGGEKNVVQRVLELAGPLADYGRPPVLEHYEEIFRVEPNDSWFDPIRSPSNTTQFEIGSLSAQTGKWIFVFDYSIRPFGFSGVGAGDTQPMPEGYLSGSFGYAMRVGGRPTGVVQYRLNPVSPAIRRRRFKFNESQLKPVADMTADDFTVSRANSFATSSGYAGEIHPQTPGRFGAHNVPFMISVGDDLPLEVTGIIFNEITLPVAFIEARISGYVTSAIIAQKLLDDLEKTTR